ALNEILPEAFVASTDQYVWIHEPDARKRTRQVKQDAYVSEGRGPREKRATSAAVSEQLTALLPAVRRKGSKYVRVEDVASRRLVTAVELLSPANKTAGDDREAYLTKRG